MPFKNYGTEDGLVDNNVQAVIRDNRGLLWVGTDFGVYWFDGKKFYQPQIKTNIGQLYVTGFYKDKQGTIWMLTFFNGIYKFQNNAFKNYFIGKDLRHSASNPVSEMQQIDVNKYIVLIDNSPYIFNGTTFSLFDAKNPALKNVVNSVIQLPNKDILLGTQNGLLVYSDRHNKPSLKSNCLKNIQIKKLLWCKGKTWVLTDAGLLVFENPNLNDNSETQKFRLKNKNIRSIYADKNGTIWAFTDKGGMWAPTDTVYRVLENKVNTYASSNGLPENIQQIYCDDEGPVWFANRKGISKLGDEFYGFYFIKNNGFNTPVTSLATGRKDHLWIGTIKGLLFKNKESIKFYNKINEHKPEYINWLYKQKDSSVLAGSDNGVLNISDKTVKFDFKQVSTAIAVDNKEKKWLGDEIGNIWNVVNGNLIKVKTNFPIAEMIVALFTANNSIWVGYRDRGIVQYTIKNDSLLFHREFSAATGYNDIRIRSCCRDNRGNIIWGTRTNGIFIFSLNNSQLIAHLNTKNGLNANWVKGMYFDNNGSLYLATNNGINILSGDYDKPVFNYVKINNDNINRETNCIIKSGDVFYVGTNEGLLKLTPGALHKEMAPPPVYFTKITIPGDKLFSINPYITRAKEIKLPYDEHFISFEFAGISLKNPENMHYRYIMEGQDNTWNPVTEHNDVSYNLKPGDYTFKVKALNADGVWSKQAAIFHFVIKPPFWESWWFILLILSVLFYLTYEAYRYKLSKVLAIELLRNKISTDLHDDIGSTLSSISILSEVGRNENDKKSKKILSEINERCQLLMEKMDDIVWSISTQHDTVGNLLSRIQQFAATVFEAKDIEYEVLISEKIKTMKVDMQQRQHIYLILKEGINNLIKYSGCSKACIKAEFVAGLLVIEVADNGSGFNLESIQPGNGLYNMEKRAKTIGGNLLIQSVPEVGTHIKLSVQIE